MPSIDTAQPGDIPQLADLLELLFTQEADFQPDRSKQERALEMILDRPENGCILVVRDGERILAMVNLLFLVSTAVGGKVVLLEDMIVHPKYRGQGLGSRLLNSAIAYAQGQGYGRITLLTDRVNENAIRFYQRHGFQSSAMIPLRLKMGSRPGDVVRHRRRQRVSADEIGPDPSGRIRMQPIEQRKYTDKQGQYLAFIYHYTKIHQVPPSQRDIQLHFNATPPTVHQMILKLEASGLLERIPGQARSIRVLLPHDELPALE